jgi:hypothetical protein
MPDDRPKDVHLSESELALSNALFDGWAKFATLNTVAHSRSADIPRRPGGAYPIEYDLTGRPLDMPKFTAAELRRAFDALDTVFQNDEPPEEEKEISEGRLIERLQEQGVTLALARALIDQVLAAGAFRSDPKRFRMDIRQVNYFDGTTVDNSKAWRALSISRDRWYAYRAERLREDNTAGATPAEDTTAYRPAKEFLDDKRFTTHKRLLAALRAHPWIRTWKPSPQRLCIHAADWLVFRKGLDDAAFDALDAPAETVEAFLAGVRERQQAIRNRKARK